MSSVVLAMQTAPANLPTPEVLPYFQEDLWICCGCCGVSSESDIDLLQLVLASKVHNCPESPQSQANCGEFQTNTYCCFIDYTKSLYCVDHNKLWKTLKAMGIPDHLTCLLKNLYVGQEAIVRIRHGTMDWFKIGKGVQQGCILSPCLFNLYAEYFIKMVSWMNHKLKSRLLGKISTNSEMQIIPL